MHRGIAGIFFALDVPSSGSIGILDRFFIESFLNWVGTTSNGGIGVTPIDFFVPEDETLFSFLTLPHEGTFTDFRTVYAVVLTYPSGPGYKKKGYPRY